MKKNNWLGKRIALPISAMSNPYVRCLFMSALIIAVLSVATYAQGTGTGTGSFGTSNSIEGTLTAMFRYFFDKVRLPFSIVGFVGAGVAYFTDEVNGPRRAIGIVIGILILALLPNIFDILQSFTKASAQ